MRFRNAISTYVVSIVVISISSGMPTMYAEGKDGSFGGGDGTPANPYIIEDVWDLQNMSLNLDACYVLGNDIDAAETRDWDSGAGFVPVGTSSSKFTGSLEGDNHTITGLFINRWTTDYVGLFGIIEKGGSVKNLGLLEIDMTGNMDVGGLVGYNNYGIITDCYAVGNVTGYGSYTGGLVGINNYGTVSNSFFMGNVTGNEHVGGLVGLHGYGGMVNNSYSSGAVTGTIDVGGLVGAINMLDMLGTVSNSHYNIDGVSINGGHHTTIGGLFDAQYQNWYSSDLSLSITDYTAVLVPSGGYYEISGIQGLRDLLGFAGVGGYRFRLIADIDLSTAPGLCIPYLVAEFDGANHTMSNLRINFSSAACAGMFGFNSGGIIKDIGVVDCDVTGGSFIGGLLGYNYYGSVSNSYATGNVSGDICVGGLMGYYYYGSVSNSYATGNVSGDTCVGGLMGYNYYGSVSNSYATGNVSGDICVGGLMGCNYHGNVSNSYTMVEVSGTEQVGGLIGFFSGFRVTNSYSTGNVSGENDIGGLVGYNTFGNIFHCYATGAVTGSHVGGLVGRNQATVTASYWDKDTSHQNSSDGGLGKTTTEMKTRSTFTLSGWDFTKIWCIIEGVTYPLLRYQDKESPTANAGPDQTVDKGALVSFDGGGSTDDIGVANYTWMFSDGDALTLHGVRPAHQFNDLGMFEVTLNVTDVLGSWDTDSMTVTVSDLTAPDADAGPDQTVDEGTVVMFNGSGCSDNVGVVNFTWTFMDGTLVTMYGIQPSYRFDNPGAFVVTLNVTDAAGRWDTDAVTVTVNDITPPVAVAGPDMTVDEGTLVTFDGSGSSDNVGIVDYIWAFVEGAPVTLSGIGPTHQFDHPGIFLVTLTVMDAAGAWDNDTLTVIVNDLMAPSADAGPDQVVNEGALVAFNGSSSADNVGIADHAWTFVDGAQVVLHGARPTYQFDHPGTFVVTLNVTDAAGNTDTDTMTVTVNDVTAPVAEAGPDLTIEAGTRVTFDGNGSTDNVGVVNYTWTFNHGTDGTVLYGVSPSFTFKVPGVYSAILRVTDAVGLWHEDTLILTVNDITPPVADAGPDRMVPVLTSVSLNGSLSSDNGGIWRYLWTITYGEMSNTLEGVKVLYSFSKGGIYEVILTVTDRSGNLDNDTVVITVVDKGWVTGAVIDTDGKSVKGAVIKIVASDGKLYSTTTAANGSFAMDIYYGAFTWRISKESYRTISGSSSVNAMNETELDLSDKPMVKEDRAGSSISSLMMLAVIMILLVVGDALFILMRRRKRGPEE